jgi:RHS repeat-associated protein
MRFSMPRLVMLCVIVWLATGVPSALAQFKTQHTYVEEIRKRQQFIALDENLFGDAISLQDGVVSFTQNDVVIGTNSDLKLIVGRKTPRGDASTGTFGDWMINIPYMHGIYDTRTGWNSGTLDGRRCSTGIHNPVLGPKLYNTGTAFLPSPWHGVTLSLPEEGEQQILRAHPTVATLLNLLFPLDGKAYVGTTKSGARLSCLPNLRNGEGEGFLLTTPDGVVYRFDWMVSVDEARNYIGPALIYPLSQIFMFPTEVMDRFGNKLTYTYDPALPRRLMSIVSSDGARVDLQYDSLGRVNKVISASRAWLYSYQPNGFGGSLLTSVQLPDGSQWAFSGASPASSIGPGSIDISGKIAKELLAVCGFVGQGGNSGGPISGTTVVMTHPSGARGEFFFRELLTGTNNTPGGYQKNRSNPIFCDDLDTPWANLVLSLVNKKISGPGLTDRTWNYSVATRFSHSAYCAQNVCPNSSTTTVTTNDGVTRKFVYGNDFQNNKGQLLSQTIEKAGVVHQQITYEYLTSAAGQPFPEYAGGSTSIESNFHIRNLPLKKIVRLQDGSTFVTEHTAFDVFARAIGVRKTNTLGHTKTDVTEYHDDRNLWVLGQVKRQYNADTNMVMAQTDYNAQALPWKTYSFGKLQQILSYWPDGNLNTVTDGRGNTTWLGDYYHGIPRLIGHPATPESPAGATQSATVDPNGWITSVTDEIGAKTCYGYDPMGRMASILYPSETQLGVCDGSRWSPVSMSFVPVNYDEHGLPAGHWRASRHEGNKHVNTYYDAMWRPVLEEALDASNIAGTVTQVVKKYDTSGRLSFQSYPANNVGHYADVTQGTRTFYDALDRVARVEQDSEHGVLATTTEYWPNLQTRVVNPRGQATVTAFMAWDQPMYDLPIASVQPEGKVIEIARHRQFGWPLQLKQRSADTTLQQIRKYVYDDHAQLCKTIEPETGATVTGYDAANNPVWSAAGLTGGDYASTAVCSHAAANASGRVVNRTYDARNRLKTLLFPDGRGNQVWNYEPDGQPRDITTFNDPNNTTPVVNGYTYNKRRMLINEYSHQPGWYTWNLGYDYDSIGNLRWQSYPTGLTVDYAPNALGQPSQVKDQNGKAYASGTQYYPNGALKQFSYGNGIVHTMYQNARQLPARSVSSGGALDMGYFYDQNANVSHIADHGRGTSYSRWMEYDGLDRLTGAGSASFGGDHWHRFSYDALDNIKSWKLGGVKDYADYVYDAQNRLTGIRNTAGATVMGIAYDPQGNLQNKNGQIYSFDYGNRLREFIGKEYYRYDGLGRRVLNGRQTTVGVSQYSQSGQLVYQEDSTQGSSEHIYLAGSLIATRINGAAIKYQHTDALGSPVAVTNEAGTVIERNDYEPYGAVIGKPNYNGIGYTGHMMDGATGLTYMQQRYYDQSIGRFLSVDPVTADANTGAMFNRYKYAANNPFRFVDPDGRQEMAAERFNEAFAKDPGAFEAFEPAAVAVTIAAVALTPVVGPSAAATLRTAVKSSPERPTVAGVQVGKTPSETRKALEQAGHAGQQVSNKAGTETGTLHNVPSMKMDVRVMNGGPKHSPRVVTTAQGTRQPVNPANGKNFGNIPKAQQLDKSHILLKPDKIP